MFIHEAGDHRNPTIVFLHAVGSSSLLWQKHFSALKDEFYCIAPDLPGHGKSNKEHWSTVEQVGKQIAGIIRDRTSNKIHVVGLSLGGILAMHLLAHYPALIERVVVDGASATPIPGAFAIRGGITILSPFLHSSVVIKAIAKSLKLKEKNADSFFTDMRNAHPRSFARALSQANSKLDLQGLEESTNPVLFLAGELEHGVAQSNKRLSKIMPNAMSIVIPGVNHGWLTQKPDLHIQLVKTWLLNGDNASMQKIWDTWPKV